MAERKIQLKYNANTQTFVVLGTARDPLVGPYVGREFTLDELKRINATFDTNSMGEYKFANLDKEQLEQLPSRKKSELSKAKKDITAEDVEYLNQGEQETPQEYAYRQGRLVTEKNINEFVGINPVTRQVTFITADAPGAGVYGGTAEGGVPSPGYAVIIPREFGIAGGPSQTAAMVYDSSVVIERFINTLIKTNRIEEFKKLLSDKGFYTLAGFNSIQVQNSLRQAETADEYFGIALDRYLNELSQVNYQNVKDGINPFKIDDYIKTVEQDFDATSAYVPSERDAEKILKATYAQYVGRTPSPEEIQAFKFALEAEAQGKPSRGVVDVETGLETTYEGFTADQLESFATEYTLERPEAQEFGAGQGGLNAISNVFQRIANKAREEIQSTIRPGSL